MISWVSCSSEVDKDTDQSGRSGSLCKLCSLRGRRIRHPAVVALRWPSRPSPELRLEECWYCSQV